MVTDRVYSFDFFDTLVHRRFGEPESVLAALPNHLRQRGWSLLLAERCVMARVRAEPRARFWCTHRGGPSLRDIWEEAVDDLGVEPGVAQALLEAEIQLEERFAYPIFASVARFEALESAGKRLAIISNTFHDATALRRVALAAGVDLSGIPVFTSSERRATKTDGGLFEIAAKELGISSSQLRHLGNDRRSDIQGGERARASVELLDIANPTRYERALSSAAPSSLGHLLAGSARVARMEAQDDDIARPLGAVGAGVIAPTIIAFVHWLLVSSRREGIERLFFLARDGRRPYETALRLAPILGWDPGEIRYLQVSRRSLAVSLLDVSNPTHLAWIWPGSPHVEANEIVARLPATLGNQMSKYLEASGASDRQQEQIDVQALFSGILEGRSGSELRERLLIDRQSTRSFLQQEGFLDDRHIALVDSAGHGTQAQALAMARSESNLSPPAAYYMRRLEDYAPRLVRTTEHGWLSNSAERRGLALPANTTAFLEFACGPSGASTCEYSEQGGGLVAVPDLSTRLHDETQATLSKIVDRVTELVASEPALLSELYNDRTAVLDACRLFWESPSPCEATVWGSLPATFAGNAHPMASPPIAKVALRFVLSGAWDGAWWQWPAASLARSSGLLRPLRRAGLRDALRRSRRSWLGVWLRRQIQKQGQSRR